MAKVFSYPIARHEVTLAGGKHRPLTQGLPITVALFDAVEQIAQLWFHPNASTMPEEDGTPAEDDTLTKFVKSHFLMSDYAHVMALLTGVQPVHCEHTRTPPQVWLTTAPRAGAASDDR